MVASSVPEPPWWTAKWFHPPIWLGVVWGFAEATLFFIMPDLIITLACLGSFVKGLRQLAAVMAGALAGGLLMYILSINHALEMTRLVQAVPYVRSSMVEAVQGDFASHGVWAVCMGPLSGIPYKLYAVIAPAFVSLFLFFVMSIPARLERLLVTFAIFAVLGVLFRRYLKRWTWLPGSVYLIYWVIVYGVYWSNI
jgi:hypothetical protein